MSWYKVELTNAQEAQGKGLEIHDKFDEVWKANGCPDDFCLFSGEVSGEFVTTLYFSPNSGDLMGKVIKENNGEECSRIRKDETKLEIGIVIDKNLLL